MAFIKEFYDYLYELEGKAQNLRHLDPDSPEIHKLQILARISEKDQQVNEDQALDEMENKKTVQDKRRKSLKEARNNRGKSKKEKKIITEEQRVRKNLLQKIKRREIALEKVRKANKELEKTLREKGEKK